MDSFKEVYEHFKERVKSPFLASFLITWIIWNWKIFVCLFMFNENMMNLHNYRTYYDCVDLNISWAYGLIYPLLGGLVFSFGYPFLKELIRLANSKAFSWGNKHNLNFLKKGKISIEKWIELQDELFRKEEILEKKIEVSSQTEIELQKAKNQIGESENEITGLKNELAELKITSKRVAKQYGEQSAQVEILRRDLEDFKDSRDALKGEVFLKNYLQDIWDSTIIFPNGKVSLELCSIVGKVFKRKDGDEFIPIAEITYVSFDLEKRLLVFHKTFYNSFSNVEVGNGVKRGKSLVNELQISKDFNEMNGLEDGQFEIKYKRRARN